MERKVTLLYCMDRYGRCVLEYVSGGDGWRETMPQVVVGLFTSYRDGHEALRALQALGLTRDHGHLYLAGKCGAVPTFIGDASDVDWGVQECAEYAAHGEHLGVAGAANRYSPDTGYSGLTADTAGPASIDTPTRTLLVVEDLRGLRPAATCAVLYDYGAVAVKDPAGHWRFSPHRKVCRSQE
jgi:hypothetical protein